MKKLLAVGVIVLFLGLAFAPSINANVSKVSIESEMVEITTEVCGLNGGKHSVKLTREEAEEVEQLFDSIRERLNATESREESEELFNEAVVELDKYGLLGDLSVKQAKRLVIGRYQNPILKRVFNRLYDRNTIVIDEGENLFCLIVGKTNNTIFEGHLSRLFSINMSGLIVVPIFGSWLDGLNPIPIGHSIGLGVFQVLWNISMNANGWVHTNGLNGVRSWNGSFRGGLSDNWKIIRRCPGFTSGLFVVYQGVDGFSGIKIYLDNFFYYMGFAKRVKISPESF